MSPLPDLESLRCFVQAVTFASFRTASRRVALSPAAFGARIRRLEDQLGTRLFVRSTRRVALTPAGAQLLPKARRCLDEAERCSRAFESAEAVPFELKLGTRFEVGMQWIVPALGPLERARPERRLHVYFGDTAWLLQQLLRDEVHCMISSARISSPNLVFARLQQEEYVFVGERRLVGELPLLGPRDARRHALLDLHADLPLFRYFLDARSPREDWVFERVQYLGGIAAVRARVLEGAGIGVLPLFFVRKDLASGKLRRLMPKTQMPRDWLRMVWRQGHVHEARLRELAAELSERPLR
jgi:LysR family transcriptional regulator, glycine cleavage system transcriptional activator